VDGEAVENDDGRQEGEAGVDDDGAAERILVERQLANKKGGCGQRAATGATAACVAAVSAPLSRPT